MSGRVVVIGLARSGIACALTLATEGCDVLVVDRADTDALRAAAASMPGRIEVRLGGYDPSVVDGAVMVCPSPGVSWDAPELERARAAGIPVRSEIDLVFERCRGHIVGITGTNGKTTTTSLTAAVIGSGGRRVHLGGNVGTTMLDRLGEVSADDWVVLELSSFQLESAGNPACDIACVLNITPDHLDRHKTFERYAAAKQRIVEHARGSAVLGWDDLTTRAMAAASPVGVRWFGMALGEHPGAGVQGDSVVLRDAAGTRPVLPVADIPLFGAHNVLNVLAATVMGDAAGVSTEEIAAAVRGFRAVPHRLQTVADREGILWVNDSKATNVDAAVKALESFERPVVWIGGGYSKGVPAVDLAAAVAAHARVAISCGATGPEVDAAVAAAGMQEHHLVTALDDAVELAAELSQPGDVVLLAPGYASFDQFHSFEERGDHFASAVLRRLDAVQEEV